MSDPHEQMERLQEEAEALSTLKQYKDRYPALFDQVANMKKKRTETLKPARSTPPSLFDQIMTPARDDDAAVLAHSNNLSIAS